MQAAWISPGTHINLDIVWGPAEAMDSWWFLFNVEKYHFL